MKYVVYKYDYTGDFYYLGEVETNIQDNDYPRNILNILRFNNIIIDTTIIVIDDNISIVGYILDNYDKEIYIFKEGEVPEYVNERLSGPQRIIMYNINNDTLVNIGTLSSRCEAEQFVNMINYKIFEQLDINKQYKCFNIPLIDNKKPYRLIEVFNLMAPDEIKITNVMHFDNLRNAENKKAELEYEVSKYPGTDVNSYFVI